MKRKIIKAGVLIVVFIAALIISSMIINSGTDDEIVDMGAPTLPRISFTVDQREVNPLFGYVQDMDITAMRDTITPLNADGSLTMNIEKNGREISDIRYEVYSLDGEEKYTEGKVEVPEEDSAATLDVGTILSGDTREAVLKVMLTVGEDTVNYYTRVAMPENLTTAECLEYAQDFHEKALNKEDTEEMESHLEPGEESDNTTYQTVNIHSDITHVQWGDLSPEIVGDVEWSIKESNTVYTSILAKYQVSCVDENGESGLYDVKEFFRVRFLVDTIYLLDYNRDMEQVFQGTPQDFDENGILFGIASDDIQYETNSDETIVAFVQERNLWLYNGEAHELTQVFSFANQEGRDMRSKNDQHAVRIISMDDDGNIAFAVYGYMNRGFHEGEVGVGIYYFSMDSNAIEEKAFIPSTKSYAIAADELAKMVYYNHEQSMLHVLADGTLYEIDLDADKQTVLAEGLTEDEYAVSDDGHLMAYQVKESEEEDKATDKDTGSGQDKTAAPSGGSQICVMNLKSGNTFTIDAAEGESVRPLGFINGDFIFGKERSSDAGVTASGEEISPMYEIEIRNSDNKTEAQYSFEDENIYTTDILIDGNLLTLNRVVKNGNVYSSTDQEYITNNQERKESDISLTTYTTDVKETQVRMSFANGIASTEPELVKPGQIASGKPLTVTISGGSSGEKFYVYGMGELIDVYDKAAYAIQKANEVAGVVISSEQQYVWERGNRDLVYSTDASSFRTEGDETSLAACERYMEQYEAHQVDLTGCELEQVLYVINRGCPVITLIDTDHAVLLTGYTTTDITYIDPEDGTNHTVGMGTMEKQTKKAGNVFIGYIR
ncbi:MAG TPA: C39 family peptidase [Candidatus Mediterraneibacter surreyensis]|nr:C39 family peptidase [Candidatus Mediterraneibacter surreyensis]